MMVVWLRDVVEPCMLQNEPWCTAIKIVHERRSTRVNKSSATAKHMLYSLIRHGMCGLVAMWLRVCPCAIVRNS